MSNFRVAYLLIVLVLLFGCSVKKDAKYYKKVENLFIDNKIDKILKIAGKNENKIDVNLIFFSIRHNKPELLKRFIPRSLTSDYAKNDLFKSAIISEAIDSGSVEMFKIVDEQIINDDDFYIKYNNFEGTKLDKAVQCGDKEMIDYLLSKNSKGIWTLCYAVQKNDIELVDKVFHTGSGKTWDFALVVAVQQGSFDIIKYFIEQKKISPNIYFEWKPDYPPFVREFYELYQVDPGGGYTETATGEALRFMNMMVVDYLRSKGGKSMKELGFTPPKPSEEFHRDHTH
ncbi:MAG TPA: hypothetical protein PK385_08755 [Spirochaetota bacterium]|nr:hypothetical protein [Spirochaetota bacterium]HOS31859.1 hypothetical protein [Spirochaetota bacterium]HOS56133.1 hypothetical protein [Spirochaetota bacterium]HPK60866.1 hypothetical protein [Spirochaetota bacterium]HQF76676.1 hypothetical protein [Spirochaetota bacterium]